MFDNRLPPLRQNLTDEFAKQLVSRLSESERDALALWKAYRKRIRTVPDDVLTAATVAYQNGLDAASIQIQVLSDAVLVMDKAGELVWEGLDETGQRDWLLKAVR